MKNTDTSWKGNCYMNAIDFVLNKYTMFPNIDVKQLRVVHCKVTGQGPLIKGHRIVHAWAEDNTYCYDHEATTNNITQIPRIEYYTLGKVQLVDLRRYTAQEVFDNVAKFNDAGPFDLELREHARNEHNSVYKEE